MMDTMNTQINSSTFANFNNLLLHLLFSFGNDFLNTSRMDSSISNKLMERQTSNFSPHRVKTRNYNSFGSIVNYKFNARSSFNSPYISTFPAYNSAFNFVALNIK